MHCKEVFGQLKPICDKVVKIPSAQNLQDLKDTFGGVSSETLTQLQDYVLYPLLLNLQRPNISSESRRYIVDCIKELIHYTDIKCIKKYLHLFSLIFIQIFDKDSSSMVANVSEELKLSVIQCATKLTQKCTDEIVCEIYNKNNVPKISQGIFICVQIMQNERSRSLRISAIEFLMTIAQVDDEEREFIQRRNVADMLMFIVPGILSGLHKVVIGDDKQGHSLTLMAVRVWSRILILVLEDINTVSKIVFDVHFSAKVTERVVKTPVTNKISEKCESKESHSILKEIQRQQRTLEWAETVSDNATKMSESLRSLQQHSHWKVRLELVEACYSLINKCHIHLKKASVIFVEILLNLSDDDTNQVSSSSQEAIKKLTKLLEAENGISLFEMLEENFYGLITKLPRILHVESDRDKLSALCLLKQYLVLLGVGRLPQLLQNSSHLQRTVVALLQVAELQSSSLSLLSDCSLRDLELNQDAVFHTPWIQFRHFADRSISEKLEEVLKLLGQNGDLEILCNHLLELLVFDTEHRNEIVFVLNEIILGGIQSAENIHLVKNMLDLYLSPELWNVPLTPSMTISQNSATPEDNVNSGQARSNLQFVCLLTEGVGHVATALGVHFGRFLMYCLYPVVERAGSPHEALTAAGLKTAAAIAKAVNQGDDITSLLAANMDYFMVQVSLRLRNLHRDPSVLSVLCVAMRHSSHKMLSYLQSAVADVLLQSCDSFQMHHTSLFLHVFYTFFVCIKKWFPSKHCNGRKQITDTSYKISSIVNEFVDYIQNSKLSRQAPCETSEEYENYAQRSKEVTENKKEENLLEYIEEEHLDKKKEIPSYIQMTVSVLQRCLHLLPRKDKQCRLQALETMTEGLEILADYEDQLLPMVHQIWSPLVGRLQDTSDPLLLNRSFMLLTLLAHLAQDFIRARTLKQVWPALCSFLSNSAEKSKNKNSGSAYQYTQLFKLQLCLLQGLGNLASNLQLQEKEIYQMLNAAVPYLSVRQPKPLQESCVQLFQTVASFEGDAVWLEMMKMHKQTTIYFKDNQEYTENIKSLLELLQASQTV